MEKVKINFEVLNENRSVELTGKNGDKIIVRSRIPYAEKEQMAYEMAASTQVIDEEKGTCYRTYQQHLLDAFLIVKYYTNIDVSEMGEADFEKLFDYLVFNELYDALFDAVEGDYLRFTYDIAYRLVSAAMESYEKEHSLAHKVNQTFGFLFTGEDLTDQLAAAEDINGKLVDMFKAVKERDEKNVLLKGGKAKVNSGGAVLNMAKK